MGAFFIISFIYWNLNIYLKFPGLIHLQSFLSFNQRHCTLFWEWGALTSRHQPMASYFIQSSVSVSAALLAAMSGLSKRRQIGCLLFWPRPGPCGGSCPGDTALVLFYGGQNCPPGLFSLDSTAKIKLLLPLSWQRQQRIRKTRWFYQ